MPQYSGVWSLQQQMQALTSGQWATDPLFDYTTLLLQGDAGANGAQNNVFYDSSPNQFAITRNGNTTQGTFSPFSATGWGNYFVEANNDYLTTNSSASFGISGDFTYEGWVYLTSTAFKRFIMPSSVSMNVDISQVSSGNMRLVFFDGTTVFNDDINTFPINTWVHVAVVRSGSASNNCAFYVNGVRGTRFTSNATNSTVSITIGRYSTNGFDGYISNLRFCKSAVYSGSSFAPPTSPLTTTSQGATNCVLLTCQSNRFVDNSATAATITPTGTPSVQAFSPFAPQFQYTASGTGGSGYFDGSGDYLTTNNINLAANAFTIEGWFYVTTTAGNMNYWGMSNGGGSTPKAVLYMDNVGNIVFETGAVSGAVISVSISTYVKRNAWQHIAISRSGTGASQTAMFIDGVRVGTGTCASLSGITAGFNIGYVGEGFGVTFNGYIAGFRIVNGTAVYNPASTTVTIPTAPLTAVTNTALLTNFTNAGIYDGTMKNNLETVGNAQISTSVVKYGSGSMYFDGTGDTLQIAPSVNALPINGNNFTIEFWYRFAVVPGTQYFYTQRYDGNNYIFIYATSTGWVFDTFSNAVQGPKITSSTITPDATNWHHFALVYLNGTYTMYVDGVSVGSQANSSVLSTLNGYIPTIPVYIASRANIDSYVNGYIDDLRITKGIARYTANFTPPLVALPRQ